MYVWIRCGDSDNYNKFDGLRDVADYLVHLGVSGPLSVQGPDNPIMGLADNDTFKGQNYISIFWGGARPEDVNKGITEEELKELNEHLDGISNI